METERRRKYSCDGGCISIGTKDCRTNFPNGYGDGEFDAIVLETQEERRKYYYQNKMMEHSTYRGSVTGDEIKVWNYDCLMEDELTEENILFTLSGRYGIYSNNGTVIFINWE